MGRPNIENLTHINERPNHHELSKKGGEANKKRWQKRKQLKEELLILLEDGDIQQRMCFTLIQEAINGSTKAFEIIRDTIGEKPMEKIAVTEIDKDVLDEVEEMVKSYDKE